MSNQVIRIGGPEFYDALCIALGKKMGIHPPCLAKTYHRPYFYLYGSELHRAQGEEGWPMGHATYLKSGLFYDYCEKRVYVCLNDWYLSRGRELLRLADGVPLPPIQTQLRFGREWNCLTFDEIVQVFLSVYVDRFVDGTTADEEGPGAGAGAGAGAGTGTLNIPEDMEIDEEEESVIEIVVEEDDDDATTIVVEDDEEETTPITIKTEPAATQTSPALGDYREAHSRLALLRHEIHTLQEELKTGLGDGSPLSPRKADSFILCLNRYKELYQEEVTATHAFVAAYWALHRHSVSDSVVASTANLMAALESTCPK
jgi:hypothetical protein